MAFSFWEVEVPFTWIAFEIIYFTTPK